MTPTERAEAVRITEEFLQGNPNPTLQNLVERVKLVSDREMEDRAAEVKAFKEERVYYRDSPPETLKDYYAIAINKNGKRYVVDKDGEGWEYSPMGKKLYERKMSEEEIVDFMRQVELHISTNPADRKQLKNIYEMIFAKLSQSPPGGSATSSPATSGLEHKPTEMGGIDFRFLPIVTQAISNLSLNTSRIPLSKLESVSLSREWQEIQRMVDAGITPSKERIKEYIQLSCLQGEFEDISKVISCIADILRDEERRCIPTKPTLKDILVVLQSGRSIQELKAVFIGTIP
jgi:hypothetical protein